MLESPQFISYLFSLGSVNYGEVYLAAEFLLMTVGVSIPPLEVLDVR